MRILVTGHNGYIGSVMVPIMQEAGHEVVGLDTYYYEDCFLKQSSKEVLSIRKDVRDVTSADLQGFNAIVHLAALANDPLGDLRPEWTYDINHIASINLAQQAKKSGVQLFLYASSCSMYGAAGNEILNEEAPLCPLTHYAISKVRTEEDLSKLADGSFSPVYMRNATAYGVSPRLRADLVLNNLVCWGFTTGKVFILSDGTPWRPIIHIEDIAHAFLAVLSAPREAIHNQAFNVGKIGENYQISDLADITQELIPGCKVEYSKDGKPDPRSYRVDFRKIAKTLPNFNPKWNARSGVQELHLAFQQVNLKIDDFQGRKFIRLAQLNHLIQNGYLDDSLRWKSVTTNS